MNLFSIAIIVLRSMFSKPATVAYPAGPSKAKPQTRGAVGIDKPQCVYCGMCSRKCPTGAITVDRVVQTWDIDRLKCIWCGACVECCPKKCLTQQHVYSKPIRASNVEGGKRA